MSKIILDKNSTNFDPLVYNENFKKIEDEFNGKVLYRNNPVGEPNEMGIDLDMNSNRIYNLPKPVAGHEPARFMDLTKDSDLFDGFLKVRDTEVTPIGDVAERKNKLLFFDDQGNPETKFPSDDSATQLRIDLAAPYGSEMVGYQPSDGLDPTTVSKQLNVHDGATDFRNIYKKRIAKVLPYRHPDYDAATSLFSGSTSAQTFTIDTVADEVFIIGNRPQIVSVFAWSTGAYKRVFCLGATATTEGAVIRYEGGSRFLYTRCSMTSLHKFDITSLPANLTYITAVEILDISLDRNFDYRAGVWTVSDRGLDPGYYRNRNRFTRYDEDFNKTGELDLGVMQVGINEGLPFTGAIPKIQGFASGDGFFVAGIGGSYSAGSTVTPYKYQGIKVFSGNGTVLADGMMDPSKVAAILTAQGLHPARVENEGVCITPDGKIYSLTMTTATASTVAIGEVEGIVIFEEFSTHPDAIDFSSAAVAWTATDVDRLQTGLHPRTSIGEGQSLFNPLNGDALLTWNDVMDYMISVGQYAFRYYSSGISLLDINGNTAPNGSVVEIRNCNNNTFIVSATGSSDGLSSNRYYRISGDPGSRGQSEFFPHGKNQTSPTDTTDGANMQVGAFGWGNTVLGIPIVDIDLTTTPSGQYSAPGGTLGTLPQNAVGNALGMVLVTRYSGLLAMQIFIGTGNGSSANYIWYRNSSALNTWKPWRNIYHSGNTTVDSNGFVKAASPIIRLFADRIEGAPGEFERVDIGNYKIGGTTGLAREGWYIETPKDANGNIKVFVEYEDGAGDLTIRTFEPDFSTGRVAAGIPADIPNGRWIDIRLHEEPEPEP